MTIAATLQTIHDGPRNLVVKANFVGDGTDATGVQLVDASAYAGYPGVGKWLKLMKVQYDLNAFAMTLLWDADSDTEFLNLQGSDTKDFTDIGGLINNAGTGITGDVNFTTLGNAAGEDGTLTMWFRKRSI